VNSSPAAAVGVGEAAVAAAGPAAVAVPAEVVALPGEAVERAEAVERDPAAIALPRLARPEATGGRVAAVGRQVVIDRKWLNGREPVAVAAADPVAECRPAAKRGPARAPPIDAPVLVLDLELLDDKTSAVQGLAAAHVSQSGLPPGPSCAGVRALSAVEVWAA
jgi:hypothetical protein